MSNYTSDYIENKQNNIIDAYLPEWAQKLNLSREVQFAIAEGQMYKDQMQRVKTALRLLFKHTVNE